MLDYREQKIIDFIEDSSACSSKEVFDGVALPLSYATF
jgi:hypothetical protein